MHESTLRRETDTAGMSGRAGHNDDVWLYYVRTELTVILGRMQLPTRRLERGSSASPSELRKALLELSDHAEDLRRLAEVVLTAPLQTSRSVRREIGSFGSPPRRPS
jgi:hypothetical protein